MGGFAQGMACGAFYAAGERVARPWGHADGFVGCLCGLGRSGVLVKYNSHIDLR